MKLCYRNLSARARQHSQTNISLSHFFWMTLPPAYVAGVEMMRNVLWRVYIYIYIRTWRERDDDGFLVWPPSWLKQIECFNFMWLLYYSFISHFGVCVSVCLCVLEGNFSQTPWSFIPFRLSTKFFNNLKTLKCKFI